MRFILATAVLLFSIQASLGGTKSHESNTQTAPSSSSSGSNKAKMFNSLNNAFQRMIPSDSTEEEPPSDFDPDAASKAAAIRAKEMRIARAAKNVSDCDLIAVRSPAKRLCVANASKKDRAKIGNGFDDLPSVDDLASSKQPTAVSKKSKPPAKELTLTEIKKAFKKNGCNGSDQNPQGECKRLGDLYAKKTGKGLPAAAQDTDAELTSIYDRSVALQCERYPNSAECKALDREADAVRASKTDSSSGKFVDVTGQGSGKAIPKRPQATRAEYDGWLNQHNCANKPSNAECIKMRTARDDAGGPSTGLPPSFGNTASPRPTGSADFDQMMAAMDARICPSDPVKLKNISYKQHCGEDFLKRMTVIEGIQCEDEADRINKKIYAYNSFIDECLQR
ncbi:hypothetical protein FJ976_17245 [Mesorhizobium sp. B1-1-9]|uniref:hypothetical protein n=1 Tax=Mesorhizobium sp. B1-1-9 TaxID=2589975 RepID=UPI00112CBC60|nr:hypothetical protein [Mesorhizobium sp. B1-1-9]TPN49476.1 hypothetical protein FJ976_17245 [Mesorhizobium sp. B1-1-9]